MEVKAHAKYLRLSPRKARLVVNAVRGKKAIDALSILALMPQKAANEIIKVIKSAIANAQHNFGLSKDLLLIKEISADIGPTFKRYKPRARGSADTIKRKMTHLSVVLMSTEKPKVLSKKETHKTTEKAKKEKPQIDNLKAKTEDKKVQKSNTEKEKSEAKNTEIEKKEIQTKAEVKVKEIKKEEKQEVAKKEEKKPEVKKSVKKSVPSTKSKKDSYSEKAKLEEKPEIKEVKKEETKEEKKEEKKEEHKKDQATESSKERFFGGLKNIFRRKD